MSPADQQVTASPAPTEDFLSSEDARQGIGGAARSGARWQVAAQAIDGLSGLGLTVVLAHLITPAVFGLVGLAATVATAISLVLTGPVASTIVAREYDDLTSLSTVWWLAHAPALVIFSLGAVITAIAFPNPDTVMAVVGALLTIPIGAFVAVQAAIHQRHLQFRNISEGRVLGALISVLAAIALALAHAPVLALVARLNLAPLVVALFLTARGQLLPRLRFDWPTAAEVIQYARGLAGFNALNQLGRQGDNVLIGSVLGSTALGLYSVAYRFIDVPISQIGQLGQVVVFPTLVRIKERSSFDAVYLRSQKLFLWLIAPLGICAIVLGDVATTSFLGAKWRGAGEVVRIFGLVGIIQALVSQSGILFMARQRNDQMFRWSAIAGPLLLLSFLIGLPWGIDGVAWAYAAMYGLILYPFWRVVSRLVDFSLSDWFLSIRAELLVAFGVIVTGLALRAVTTLDGAAPIAGIGLALALSYWGATLAIDRSVRADLASLVPVRVGRFLRSSRAST